MMFVQITEETTKLVSLVPLSCHGDRQRIFSMGLHQNISEMMN
jgi:hypothetical protein